jgi:RecQ-mediated genome instability protein 1
MPTGANHLTAQLTSDLLTRHHLPVSPIWLSTFLHNTRQPLPPLTALMSTAHFRLLASDFTSSLSTADSIYLLPADINNAETKERKLPGNVPVQLLDVEDIGRSKWSQIEAIERIERGEEVRGREVIRTVPTAIEGDEGSSTAPAIGAGETGKSNGPHRFILQDAKGTKVVAFELQKIPRLEIGDEGMAIGMKVLLKKGALVRRGVLILKPDDVTPLGGKIEAWDKRWREGRKGRLTRDLEREVTMLED